MSQIEITTIGAIAAMRIVGATLAMSACKGNVKLDQSRLHTNYFKRVQSAYG